MRYADDSRVGARSWAEGPFREDLSYRINVIPSRLPSLLERGEDTLIAAHFVAWFARQMARR